MSLVSNLTYKQKLKLLSIFILPILFICYKLAFANTIQEYKKYREYLNQNTSLNNSENSLSALNAKKQAIETFLKEYELDTLNTNKNLIAVVTNFCNENRLEFKEYKPLNIFHVQELPVFTRAVTVEGDFIKCLQLVYALENENPVGHVSSVQYKTYEDVQTKAVRLNCTLYIQNIVSQ
jgi:hypothetical protein